MPPPTFKKATDTAAGSSAIYGAPDVKYAFDVLDGTHSTDRVQVQNIERFATPWHYHIYKDGAGTTYARRGDTGRAEFSGSDSKTVAQSALDQAYTEFTRAVLTFGPQTFDFANQGLDIATKSNILIKGSGMQRTKISNGSIVKNDPTATSNVQISDMTIDGTGVRVNCINLVSGISNVKLSGLRLERTSTSFCLDWAGTDQLVCHGCLFIDGGMVSGADNMAGAQLYSSNKMSVISNCYFEKTSASLGGGMFTTGSTGNILVDGCVFFNNGSPSYNALSFENYFGPIKNIMVTNCSGYGAEMGCAIGIPEGDSGGSSGVIERGIITNCSMAAPLRIRRAREGIISDSSVLNSQSYGISMILCGRGTISNCTIRNTNTFGTQSPLYFGAAIYCDTNTYLNINRVFVIDDQAPAKTTYGAYITQGTVGTNTVRITECWLQGPFTTNSLLVSNTLNLTMRGSQLNGTVSFTSNTNPRLYYVYGYQPVGMGTITMGASPYTYTNADGDAQMIHLFGGTVTDVSKNSVQIGNTTPFSSWLEPGESLTVTYTGTPTMRKDRK